MLGAPTSCASSAGSVPRSISFRTPTSRSSRSSSAWSGWSSTPRPSPPPSRSPRARAAGRPSAAAHRRERARPAGVVPRHRRGDPRRACDHAGRRMAGRQLPHRRRAAPRDPRRPAAAATTASCPSWPTGQLAGYPRVFGIAWAYVAHTDSRFDPETPAALRARVPGGAAADDRRAVGDRDHPADRAGREPPAPGRADRAQPGGAAGGGRARRRLARPRHGRPRADGARPCAASRAALPSAASRSSSSSACATRTRRSRPPSLAGGAPRGRRDDRRGDRAPRAPAPGGDERDGPQRDHEHAADLRGSTGRSSSRASAWSTRSSRRAAHFAATWTSRLAIATGTPSRSWRGARGHTEVEVARRRGDGGRPRARRATAGRRRADAPQRIPATT